MKVFFKHNPRSAWALVLSLIAIVIMRLFVAPLNDILVWDVFGYYLYLPSYFIYHDPTLQNMDWVNKIIAEYPITGSFYQAIKAENGNWVMRYPGGLALLNLPFFLVADAVAQPMGYVRDGFSAPYQVMWALGSLFYTIVGLWISRKVLLRYFDDITTAFLLIVLVFATNFLQMASYGNPLAHIFLFSLYALAFSNIQKWGEGITLKNAFATGLLIGLITICRPNELVFILIPLLWNIQKGNPITDRWKFVADHFKAFCFFMAGLVAGGLPQMLYWKLSSGSFLFYSYQDNGVGFDFLEPHIADFLFSYRKGWFIYTPVMLFACIGFYHLYRKNRSLFYPLFAYFIVNLYITSSWTVWWYAGGSYSSRSLVSSYLLMCIPLGYLVDYIRRQKNIIRIISLALAGFFILLNLFQFWQSQNRLLDGERITKAYYWRVFGKTTFDPEDRKLLLVERQTTPYETMPDTAAFTRKELVRLIPSVKEHPDRVKEIWVDSILTPVMVLDSNQIYSPALEKSFREITVKEYAWLRVRAEIFVPDSLADEPPLLIVQFNYKEKPYKYTSSENQVPLVKRGNWHTLEIQYMTPEVRSVKDVMKVYMWYRGKNPVYLRKLEVVAFEPR